MYIPKTLAELIAIESHTPQVPNYEFVSALGVRIPCHNMATLLYYKKKEEAESKLNLNQ